MTDIPFIITGKVLDLDKSTELANVEVTVKNVSTGETTSTTTNSTGDYAVDTANMSSGVTAGQVLRTLFIGVNKARFVDTTITQAMIDSGSKTVNTTIYGMRKHIFSVIETLYENNTPPDYTAQGTTNSWTVTSAFPESNPTFPVLVIDPARLGVMSETMDSSAQSSEVSVETMFYAKKEHQKVVIDEARDYMNSILLANEDDLNFKRLYFRKPTYIDDSNISSIEFNQNKFNMANQILMLRWNP